MPLASRDRPHKDPHPSQDSHFFSPARARRLSSSSGPSRPPRGQPRPVPVARVPPRTRPTPPARQLPLWGDSPPPTGRARRLLAALPPQPPARAGRATPAGSRRRAARRPHGQQRLARRRLDAPSGAMKSLGRGVGGREGEVGDGGGVGAQGRRVGARGGRWWCVGGGARTEEAGRAADVGIQGIGQVERGGLVGHQQLPSEGSGRRGCDSASRPLRDARP